MFKHCDTLFHKIINSVPTIWRHTQTQTEVHTHRQAHMYTDRDTHQVSSTNMYGHLSKINICNITTGKKFLKNIYQFHSSHQCASFYTDTCYN